MPYEPLHHKYRPQTFKDLVGQETIALTLSNALKQEKIAPAYLFTGPRGTGKTSSARILAKSLNCLASSKPTPEPCGKCEACLTIARGSALDVMEIDAASNTGVDNIREIIERSRFAPVQCRYKIYAIDECHMLSTAAFNALLKTLEEPPPRVVFILATTDPQRVLSTIISRCQRFDYRRIPLTEMTAHLKYIADAEQIAIADDALTLIAQIANGGLRDAESLLDQLSLLPEISVARVWDLVGAVPEQDLLKLLQAINRNDSLEILQQCRSLLDRGREPLIVLQNLASFYLNLLIAKTAPQRPDLIAVTETCWQNLCTEAANWDTSSILRGQQQLKEAETQLKHTTQPRLWLEVALLGLLPQANMAIARSPAVNLSNTAPNNLKSSTSNELAAVDVPPPPASKTPVAPSSKLSQGDRYQKIELDNPQKATVSSNTPTPASIPSQESDTSDRVLQDAINNQEIWSKIVSCLQPPTTQALLKQQCHLVSYDGSTAIVGISSAKLQKLNQGKIPNIEAAFAKVCQRKVKVQLEVAKKNTSVKNSGSGSSELTAEVSQPAPQKSLTSAEKESQSLSATTPDTESLSNRQDYLAQSRKVAKKEADEKESQSLSATTPDTESCSNRQDYLAQSGQTHSLRSKQARPAHAEPSSASFLAQSPAKQDDGTNSAVRRKAQGNADQDSRKVAKNKITDLNAIGERRIETKLDPTFKTYLANKDRDPQSDSRFELDGQSDSTSATNSAANSIPNKAIAPPPIAELDPYSDYADDLQQAINNLTQSFEGELVQFDRSQGNFLTSDRPDVEDYDDEW